VKFTVIENTDVRVSRLSFGTGALHHLLEARQRQRLLAAAVDAGITHFDTSPYYGYGLAEFDLGKFMCGRRTEFTIATKVGLYPSGKAARSGCEVWLRKALAKVHKRYGLPVVDWNVGQARASLHASLKRLRTDYVDFLFLHEPDLSMVDSEEFLRWLEIERTTGTIRYWGLAGLSSLLEPWLQAGSPLASVVQTKDNLTERCADFACQHRHLQFTYGYLSAHAQHGGTGPFTEVLRSALLRNTHGSVLVSTRRPERLRSLASVVH
jgi:aryl-alcohol dehydrogenase-like predicted oxidoreductase